MIIWKWEEKHGTYAAVSKTIPVDAIQSLRTDWQDGRSSVCLIGDEKGVPVVTVVHGTVLVPSMMEDPWRSRAKGLCARGAKACERWSSKRREAGG